MNDLEQRDAAYTDTLITLIQSAAGRTATANPKSLSALEASAAAVGKAFAIAKVKNDKGALTPSVLNLIGRSLIREGEFVALLDVNASRAVLHPAASFDISGSYDPQTWRYELNLSAPSELTTKRVGQDGVVHIMYGREAERPWRGLSPLEVAFATGALASGVTESLSNEVTSPVGNIIALPQSGDKSKLEAELGAAKGDVILAETTSGGWGDGKAQAPARDWTPIRLGPNPPASLVSLSTLTDQAIYAACGIPASLMMADADGTSQREAWRRFLFGTVAPLGELVAEELSAKLETPVKISWDELRASDLQGRARAFASMVSAGMDKSRAETLAGFAPE